MLYPVVVSVACCAPLETDPCILMRLLGSTSVIGRLCCLIELSEDMRGHQPHADRCKEELALAGLADASPLASKFVEHLKETALILRGEMDGILALDANCAS